MAVKVVDMVGIWVLHDFCGGVALSNLVVCGLGFGLYLRFRCSNIHSVI